MPPGCLLIAVAALILTACTAARAEPERTPAPTGTPTRSPLPTLAIPTPRPSPTPTATAEPLCPLPSLPAGLHISASGSYLESETEAAGPMVCRITRGSCAFHLLVGSLDPTIVFKREEPPPYDEEDLLMHPDMLLPLTRLNELVQAEWGGEVQLRVTDAYDSLLEHHVWEPDLDRRVALHFEGRSIDLTTYPVDLARYDRLCALAHCAGFDWVHNEGDHCHASIAAPSLCTQCSN